MSVMIFDTTQEIENSMFEQHKTVITQFNEVVADFRCLIEEREDAICFVPVSFGKDSTLVAIAAIEAYKQAIEAGTVEASRPLIMSTGDPQAEAIPMKMYTRYAAPLLIEYGKRHNINIHHDFVTPTFYETFANRYFTAQKLIPNATRSGDCSVILKVVPSERYLRQLLERFKDDPKRAQYTNATVICATGQRNQESSRRAGNMKAQGTSDKSVLGLMEEMKEAETKTAFPLYLFAPIRDWSTDEVFMALELAGEKPLTRNLLGLHNPIPAFMSDFALLLAIYGNASNESCEIAVGTNQTSGCNGRSRYGCLICPMISKDKTQFALSHHPRWQALLQEEVLRVRDYMFRLSTRNDARMMHAKAYDPLGYGRIALQGNVLKMKYLEKLVRYTAQLSIESAKRAKEFARLVEEGRDDEHIGIQDIKADPTLNAKARRRFIEMYKAEATKPMITLFSERHAVYLSWRWSLDGIKSLPYRPLAIWHQLSEGRGWIPYPQTNDEYEAKHGKIKLQDASTPLADAVMFPTFKEENLDAQRYVSNYRSLMSYWSRPFHTTDILDERNCLSQNTHVHSTPTKVVAQVRVSLVEQSSKETIPLFAQVKAEGQFQWISLGYVELQHSALEKLTIDGRVANNELIAEFKNNHFEEIVQLRVKEWCGEMQDYLESADFSSLDEAHNFVEHEMEKAFPTSSDYVFNMVIPFVASSPAFPGYQPTARVVSMRREFTKRVAKKKGGKLVKGNSRMAFYELDVEPKLHYAHTDNKMQIKTELTSHSELIIDKASHQLDRNPTLGDKMNVKVTDQTIERWKLTGGYHYALRLHDMTFAQNVQRRHQPGPKSSIRHYPVCAVAESMMREGAVIISSAYFPTYRSLSKRTQLFEEIGAFDYQNHTAEELLALPFTVSMEQHRKDKVAVLQCIRKARNEKRKIIKAELYNPFASIQQRIGQFFVQADFNMKMFIDATNNNLFKSAFCTQEISFSQTARACSTWLNIHAEALSNYDTLLKTVCSAHQLNCIKSDIALGRNVAKLIQSQIGKLLKRDHISVWKGMTTGARALYAKHRDDMHAIVDDVAEYSFVDGFMEGIEDYSKQKQSPEHQATQELSHAIVKEYRSLVTEWHPQTEWVSFKPDANHWNPNLKTLSDELETMAKGEKHCQRVKAIMDDLETMAKRGFRDAVSGMSLAQRLMASNAKAAAPVQTAELRSVNRKMVSAQKPKISNKKPKAKVSLATLSDAHIQHEAKQHESRI